MSPSENWPALAYAELVRLWYKQNGADVSVVLKGDKKR